MNRIEFNRATRRDALKRSGMLCEATGVRYGYEPDHRCSAPLANGVEFDHYVPFELSRDSSLDNCRAICIRCHRFATPNDIRTIRKSDRQRDKDDGSFWKQKRPLGSSRYRQKVSGQVIDKSTGQLVSGGRTR